MAPAVLEVKDLSTHLNTRRGLVKAVDHVSFIIEKGEIFGLVGESGSGKSMTALSVMGLVPNPPGEVVSGEIVLNGRDITKLSEKELGLIRGREMSMIFQDPLTSLDPLVRVGDQIVETIRTHKKIGKDEAIQEAERLLSDVGISGAHVRSKQYPFELSGGMRQRIMIALAICTKPSLLIADEPTTNLDVTIQAQVLELIKSIRDRTGNAILLITHNMGIVAWLCDRIGIMYAGQIVECGPTKDIFKNPSHPYTADLLRAVPKAKRDREQLYSIAGEVPDLTSLPTGCRYHPRCAFMKSICLEKEPSVTPIRNDSNSFVRCFMYETDLWKAGEMNSRKKDGPGGVCCQNLTVETTVEDKEKDSAQKGSPLVSVLDLTKHFPITSGFFVKNSRGFVHAVDGVSFAIMSGETLAIVGESGCGKTTLAKLIVRLIKQTSGSIKFEGVETSSLSGSDLQRFRKKIGMIFQDPFASLDPRMSVGRIIEEPMRAHGIPKNERHAKTTELLALVGLKPQDATRYPHQFSGGQRQRIAIARALALSPSIVIADEPTSALDVSVQAKIINLFMELRRRLDIAFIFISHDLSVVRYVSNRVLVMYLGKIMEEADTEELFKRPLHPYTQALLSSVPVPDPVEMEARPPKALGGETSSLVAPPVACRFHTRCPYAQELCKEKEPIFEDADHGHRVACHFWREIEWQQHQKSLASLSSS